MSKLKASMVTHQWQVEIMRCLYNHCLSHLNTKGLEPVSAQEQIRWWNSRDRARVQAFLFTPIGRPWHFVAFVLLQKKGKHFWTVVMGLAEEARGQGYGREVSEFYLKWVDGPMAADALVSNEVVLDLDRKMGWRVMAFKDEVVKLYHPGPYPLCQEVYEEIRRYHGV